MNRRNLVGGLAWACLAVLSWMPLFSVAKRTLPYMDAFALGTVRYGVGILLFVALLAALEGRRAFRLEGRLGDAALFGVIGITGFNLFVWIGLAFTRPEHASVIMAMQTPLTALAVWLWRGQRPAAFTLACVAVAIAGVLLVISRGHPLEAIEDVARGRALFGDFLVFCGALCWVVYGLSGSRFPQWSPLRFTVFTCVPGAIGLLVANVVAVAAGWASVPAPGVVASVAWQLAYFSLGTVVLGVLSFNNATRRLGPLNTMLMLNMVPVGVFGIEAGLGRSFAPAELAGAAIVVSVLAANNLYLRRGAAAGTSSSR